MILVDPIVRHPAALCRGLPGRLWCHMMSDASAEELHAFAARIGCRRSWFQGPPEHRSHYDLTPARRKRAVELGAVEVTSRELVTRTFDSIVRARPPAEQPIACTQCGRPVEGPRRCYAIPTCYRCLPPPEPLPIAHLRPIRTVPMPLPRAQVHATMCARCPFRPDGTGLAQDEIGAIRARVELGLPFYCHDTALLDPRTRLTAAGDPDGVQPHMELCRGGWEAYLAAWRARHMAAGVTPEPRRKDRP